MNKPRGSPKGRGTGLNPVNRFERLEVVLDDGEQGSSGTVYLDDRSRTVLTRNSSPDIGYEYSVNPYRGCEHGCIYCYARPTHEYLGFSCGLDFETRILVKRDAPALLRQALRSPSRRFQPVALSGVTDPYQPVERKLELTRACLKVLVEAGNPVSIVTKNHLILRDLDLLRALAGEHLVQVRLSVTSLDPGLHRILEPRTSTPTLRLEAISRLSTEGVPVGVMVAPVIPGLTDHEFPSILKHAREAGAIAASYQILRLPYAVNELFLDWLRSNFPQRAAKVLNRIGEVRRGNLSDSRFHLRMTGEGVYAEQISDLFAHVKRKLGFLEEFPPFAAPGSCRPRQPELPWR